MKNSVTLFPSLHTSARLSAFIPGGSGINEHHLIITITNPRLSFSNQVANITETVRQIAQTLPEDSVAVFRRWFLSDSANQAQHLPLQCDGAVSVVEQPPLNGSKAALWIVFQQGMTVTPGPLPGIVTARHGEYAHLWQGSAAVAQLHSEIATIAMLEQLMLGLEQAGGSLADNCVRTWFFVHDVDVNYSGVVTGRNKAFAVAGLSKDTHFIASTGIGGRHADKDVTVEMDSYSVIPLAPGQMTYLYAAYHLNPTYEYGVAFERGTRVDYGDRRHLFISGTASIDNGGNIVHPGDICGQTRRMVENVDALLHEGGCNRTDVAHILVYLRDGADYPLVSEMMAEAYPDTPTVILLAPVCRPGWLIEMECMAIAGQNCPRFAAL